MKPNTVRFRPNVRAQELEVCGGNLYRPHTLLTATGEYWRCRHGVTGNEHHLIVKCLRCWVGYQLSLVVDSFENTGCVMCLNKENRNIINHTFVCDNCFNTILREREQRKVKRETSR